MTIRNFAILLLLTLVSATAQAEREERDGNVLMRGRCHTVEQAREVMAQYATRHSSRETWSAHRQHMLQGILEGAQLDNLPEQREAPRAFRHSKHEMNGYTVECIAIETIESFWLAGNLYLPQDHDTASEQLIPGVLCPHGHWPNGRMSEQTQARCAALARMGCAVIAYDILGSGDTHQVAHDHPQSLRLHHYNSIRTLDYLCSLSFIDQERLAVTGASGGGTQTFVLAAIDDRVDLAIPACQVSAHFYGGCVCESGMPIHVNDHVETNNVEIAACFAPKPMLLISNGGDWTADTPNTEYPYIRSIYDYYDTEANLEHAHFADEGHDYGPSKRAAAYRFIARHFDLNLGAVLDEDGEVSEDWLEVLPEEKLRVFNEQHPLPAGATQQPEQVFEALDSIP